MKRNLLKTVIATTLGLTGTASCGVEHGIIIYKQDLAEERAVYVNLIGKKHTKDVFPLDSCDFSADRKLFFEGQNQVNQFGCLLAGDTIVFRNRAHDTYVDLNNKNKILKINGVRER